MDQYEVKWNWINLHWLALKRTKMVSLVPNIIYTHKMFQCNWKCFLLLKRPSIDSFFLFLKELVTTRYGTWTSVTRSDRYCNQAVVTHVLLTISISKSTKKLTHNHSDAHYFQILKATAVDLDLSDLCSTCCGHTY